MLIMGENPIHPFISAFPLSLWKNHMRNMAKRASHLTRQKQALFTEVNMWPYVNNIW